MWLLFGAASKKKSISGGLEIERFCNECGCSRTFVECEIEDKVDVFFVPVLSGKTRALMCSECCADVELPQLPAPRKQLPPRQSASEREKDAMLAALKKKMSRAT